MILIDIQDNIIRCNDILEGFENDFIYKIYKMFGGNGTFENTIRDISNQSINLRNNIIVDVEAAIRATNNKELISIIEMDYFNKITGAATANSLIKIVNLNSITIPITAMNIVSQDDKVIQVINSISININSYNNTISNFRQRWNRHKITLYNFPTINKYPNILEGQINLVNLIAPSNKVQSIQSKKPKPKVNPINPQKPQSQKSTNSPSNNISSITKKF